MWARERDSEVRTMDRGFTGSHQGLSGSPIRRDCAYLYQPVTVIMMYKEAKQSKKWKTE